MFTIKGIYSEAKVFADELDKASTEQLTALCNQPFTEGSKLRIMPDAHAGKGCVIGTTMTITNKVVPNLVGVDIGCGMLTINIGKINPDWDKLDKLIREKIPSGFTIRQSVCQEYNADRRLNELNCAHVLDMDRAERACGSLGGGNHFIEVDVDDDGYYYLVIHSGSRNPGLQVAVHYQKVAGEACDQSVPYDLRYLEGEQLEDYMADVVIMENFARMSRLVMAKEITQGMRWEADWQGSFHTVHNTLALNAGKWVLRKGATSAQDGEMLLIPMNMRDGSLLCRGKGNHDWNDSAPHGAGRLYSRTQAKSKLTLEDFKKQMEGIYSSCVTKGTLDESPMAYKPMEGILTNIGPSVDVLKTIKPVYNFKAGGD